jgi:uncharacterized protein YcbK (DUF882 family)
MVGFTFMPSPTRGSIGVRARLRVVAIAFLTGCAHPQPGPVESAAPHVVEPVPVRTKVVPETAVAGPPASAAPVPHALWTEGLPPISVYNANTELQEGILLYAPDGAIDPKALRSFAEVAAAKDAPQPKLNARLVQLVVKAAYHFGSSKVTIVSAFRPLRRGRGGKHSTGEAIDFKLRGVEARKLASYLRTLPRVGVGIYTNPNTQFCHLDVREDSFHWIDASPPGKRWREKPLHDSGREERDAAYSLESDLPDARPLR